MQRGLMIHYQPIFKAKPGEFAAWFNAGPAVRAATLPVFEMDWSGKSDFHNYLKSCVKSWAGSHAPGELVVVDSATLDQTAPIAPNGQRIIPWLAGELASHTLKLRPVVRPTDDPVVIADVAAVAATTTAGVVIRFGTPRVPPAVADVRAHLVPLAQSLGIAPNETHLLLDFQEMADQSAIAQLTPVANSVLAWVATQPPLGSVHVTSAAFPASISGMPQSTANLIIRWDAQFYAGLTSPTGLDVGYSDYVVNNPAPGSPDARTPLPNLRYTTGSHWLIWREPKAQPGNSAFHTVCQRLVASPHYAGPAYSWGDEMIDDKARRVGNAGGAKEWRSYATSHHLQTVVDRLATLGAP
jgi:hypothetical protein